MCKTTVVNLRHEKYDVYIGRGSPFGNPFVIGKDGDRNWVVGYFELYFLRRVGTDEEFKKKVMALKGRRLGCYCSPKMCHGDVIVEYLEGCYEETVISGDTADQT